MTGLFALAALARPALLPPTAPKLVLLISIDQGRADYVDRFSDQYLPAKKGGTLGGFRWLSETGVRFLDAHHHHLPTATGPGHSVLMTGSVPALNGIVGNDWWDRAKGKARYVTDDDTVRTVGGGNSGPMSARPLKVTTVGDELKMATNDRAKVVGLSFKDRAAILMAGHAADEVVWADYDTGGLVTSTYYTNDLPAWAKAVNSSHAIDAYLGKAWTPSLPAAAYANARNAPHETGSKTFSHPYGAEKNRRYVSNVIASGAGQAFIVETAEKAIDAEGLGRHEVPDVFVLNLASNDYVGHAWGPNSPEVEEIAVDTDRLLSRLFNHLDRTIPGGIDNVAIVVTADHGVAPIPADAQRDRIDAARLQGGDVVKAVDAALAAKYGAGRWVLGGLYEQNLFLDRGLMDAKGLRHSDVEQAAADAAMTVPGVYQAYTRTHILAGELPRVPWSDWITNGLNPINGGDVMVLEAPNVVQTGATGTSHGTAWAYDTHVPILTHWGGQRPQRVARRVYTHDIASTLCKLLGIEYPSGNVGHPLEEALPLRP